MRTIELTKSSHMRLAIQRCGATKRRFVNVLRPKWESEYTPHVKVPSMDALKKRTNVLDPFLIERCQDVQPWEEV